MIHVHISEPFLGILPEAILVAAAEAVYKYRQVPTNSELSIVIDDDAALQKLNQDYLGIDAPTDVLSFAADETDPESGNPYLGDIIISLPRATTQAENAGHSVESELQLLVVHGVLHLLGMDHADPDGKREMWDAQTAILRRLDTKLARWPD